MTNDALPVLDQAALDELRALGDVDLVREAISRFVSDTERALQAIGEEWAAGELGPIVRRAHTVKGASLTLGARRLAAAMARIEEAAREGHVQRTGVALPEATSAWTDVRPLLLAEAAWEVRTYGRATTPR